MTETVCQGTPLDALPRRSGFSDRPKVVILQPGGLIPAPRCRFVQSHIQLVIHGLQINEPASGPAGLEKLQVLRVAGVQPDGAAAASCMGSGPANEGESLIICLRHKRLSGSPAPRMLRYQRCPFIRLPMMANVLHSIRKAFNVLHDKVRHAVIAAFYNIQALIMSFVRALQQKLRGKAGHDNDVR